IVELGLRTARGAMNDKCALSQSSTPCRLPFPQHRATPVIGGGARAHLDAGPFIVGAEGALHLFPSQGGGTGRDLTVMGTLGWRGGTP
ncbi:MAG TPA: hypothetical protein VGD77_11660, partial [Gemmatimonadaceae bacterium]